MDQNAKWIWLGKAKHPDLQTAPPTYYCDRDGYDGYCVAEFTRDYRFDLPAKKLNIDICADTSYRLWINGAYVGSGPVYSGGDNSSTVAADRRFYSSYELPTDRKTLSFRVLVRKNPVIMAESSAGVGGLILSCRIYYGDDTVGSVYTDETWNVRVLPSRKSETETDYTLDPPDRETAEPISYPVPLYKSPIPNLTEEQVFPENKAMYICPPHSRARFCVDFDRIYSAYLLFSCDGDDYTVTAGASENEDEPYQTEKITAKGSLEYFSKQYASYGKAIFDVENNGERDVKISEVSLLYRHYPVTRRGTFSCSDDDVNAVWELCVKTLEICRQDLHLDSPRHREPLGCTGDYYIQSLMEYYAFGDTALTRFDIVRTGNYLLQNDGRMFHTSYSLIWIMMIYDYYMYTGDTSVFPETEAAMEKLLERFSGYVGKKGVIDSAPNYMFLDWINVGGFDLHHPPRALGQAALNAFYYRALDLASRIYAICGNNKLRSKYRIAADAVKASFNACFYDESRGLYFAGLGGKRRNEENEWLPENVGKKYYLRQVNALAVLFEICDTSVAKKLAERVVADKTLGDVQPYFMHYIFDVAYKYGLFEKYGMDMILRWKPLVEECPKGLAEGWGEFKGDHSHAWGGTPAYQLPRAFLGLEMVGAGFSEIRLSPKLFGTAFADISVPTPYGDIKCKLARGKAPVIDVPDGIKYTIV